MYNYDDSVHVYVHYTPSAEASVSTAMYIGSYIPTFPIRYLGLIINVIVPQIIRICFQIFLANIKSFSNAKRCSDDNEDYLCYFRIYSR